MKTLLLIATLTLSMTTFAGATNDASSDEMGCGNDTISIYGINPTGTGSVTANQ